MEAIEKKGKKEARGQNGVAGRVSTTSRGVYCVHAVLCSAVQCSVVWCGAVRWVGMRRAAYLDFDPFLSVATKKKKKGIPLLRVALFSHSLPTLPP